MENANLQTHIKTIEERLTGKTRVITEGDVVAITGSTMRDAKDILEALMSRYTCRLKVTENGEIIYDFGERLHPRGERTWAEFWAIVRKQAWKAFMVFFKIWIAVTLVVYFLIFLIILIAAIVALMSGGSSNNNSSSSSSKSSFGLGRVFVLLVDVFQSLGRLDTRGSGTHYSTDFYGYTYLSYNTPTTKASKLNKKDKKGFVASVYDYVFGPPRVEISPLTNIRELAAYLRENKGVTVTSELIGLAGWTAAEAQEFMSEAVVHFDGEAKIAENGVLYGEFDQLVRSKKTGEDAPIIWFWDEYEPPYLLTGNTKGRNGWITFLNAFNFVFASIFFFGYLSMEAAYVGPDEYYIFIGLGLIPFIFSLIFFGVPLYRMGQVRRQEKARRMANIRKRLLKVIYKNPNRSFTLSELETLINAPDKTEEKLDSATIQKMMQDLIYDFDGEVSASTEAGEVSYSFERLRIELETVAELRKGRDTSFGEVVFDSSDDD